MESQQYSPPCSEQKHNMPKSRGWMMGLILCSGMLLCVIHWISICFVFSSSHYRGLQITFTSCNVSCRSAFIAFKLSHSSMASLFRMVTVNNDTNIVYSWSCSLLIAVACKASNRSCCSRPISGWGRTWGGSITSLKSCSLFGRGEFSLIKAA